MLLYFIDSLCVCNIVVMLLLMEMFCFLGLLCVWCCWGDWLFWWRLLCWRGNWIEYCYWVLVDWFCSLYGWCWVELGIDVWLLCWIRGCGIYLLGCWGWGWGFWFILGCKLCVLLFLVVVWCFWLFFSVMWGICFFVWRGSGCGGIGLWFFWILDGMLWL